MVLPMYLGHYAQASVHDKYAATSKYGYIYAKQAITKSSKNTIITKYVKLIPSVIPRVGELAILHIKLSHKVYFDQKAWIEKKSIL